MAPFLSKMKTIEVNHRISEDRFLTLQLPSSIQPGEHHILIVIDEQPLKKEPINEKKPLKFNNFSWNAWQDDCTFRREDLYDDDGR